MLDQICPTEDLCDSKLEQCRVCNDRRSTLRRRPASGMQRRRHRVGQPSRSARPTRCATRPSAATAPRASSRAGAWAKPWTASSGSVAAEMSGRCCSTPASRPASAPRASTWPAPIRTGRRSASRRCAKAREPSAAKAQELQRCRQDLTGWDSIDTCASVELCEQGVENATVSAGLVDMCPLGCLSAGMFVCEDQALTRCRDDLTGYDFVTSVRAGDRLQPAAGFVHGPLRARATTSATARSSGAASSDHTWEEVARCASPVLCITSFEGERATFRRVHAARHARRRVRSSATERPSTNAGRISRAGKRRAPAIRPRSAAPPTRSVTTPICLPGRAPLLRQRHGQRAPALQRQPHRLGRAR